MVPPSYDDGEATDDDCDEGGVQRLCDSAMSPAAVAARLRDVHKALAVTQVSDRMTEAASRRRPHLIYPTRIIDCTDATQRHLRIRVKAQRESSLCVLPVCRESALRSGCQDATKRW